MKEKVHLIEGVILVRQYRPTDVNRLYEAVRESIPEVSLWLPWCHADYSIEESKTWIESQSNAWETGTEYNLAITDSKGGFFLGGCGLNNISHTDRVANLGYWVRSSRTRQGVATTAALLLARFGFRKLKLNRIEITIAVGNEVSQRVAERIGAAREGVLRNRLVVRDKVYDAVVYSLIPQDLTLSD